MKPMIRFKEFNNAWEKQKLGRLVDIMMGVSPSSKNYTMDKNYPILVQGNADIKKEKIIGRVRTKEITKLAPKYSTLLTVRAPVGDVYIASEDVVIGRGIAALSENKFIYYMLRYLKLNHYWDQHSTGSTFESINKSDIYDVSLYVPNNKESERIIYLLNNIFYLNTLYERKLELLELMKKGFLQKILVADNCDYPEVRFNCFNNIWRKCKLGKIFSYKQGQQVPIEDQFFENGPNRQRFIRIVDLTTDSESPRYIDYEGDNKILFDDLFMIRYGNPGIVGYGYEGVIANNLFKLIPKIETYNLFFKYALDNMYPKIKSLSSSTTMPALNFQSLDVLSINYPEIPEQINIGQFFKKIEDLIIFSSHKLDLILLIKKGFLQKMFV